MKKIKELEENNTLEKRLTMLKKGMINIIVGAPTITERREKKMRYDDALCALKTIEYGVIPGSGIVLLEVSQKMNKDTNGDYILKEALKSPFLEIMANAGLDKDKIMQEIIESDYNKIFNINKNSYENILDTEVMDSTKVVLNQCY